MAEESNASSGGLHRPIVGTWHLLDTSADEINVPAHRMDLRFLAEPPLRAVIVSRVTGDEMPLIHWAVFDGEVLRTSDRRTPGQKPDRDAGPRDARGRGQVPGTLAATGRRYRPVFETDTSPRELSYGVQRAAAADEQRRVTAITEE